MPTGIDPSWILIDEVFYDYKFTKFIFEQSFLPRQEWERRKNRMCY